MTEEQIRQEQKNRVERHHVPIDFLTTDLFANGILSSDESLDFSFPESLKVCSTPPAENGPFLALPSECGQFQTSPLQTGHVQVNHQKGGQFQTPSAANVQFQTPPPESGQFQTLLERGQFLTPPPENVSYQTPILESGLFQTLPHKSGHFQTSPKESGQPQTPSSESGQFQTPPVSSGHSQIVDSLVAPSSYTPTLACPPTPPITPTPVTKDTEIYSEDQEIKGKSSPAPSGRGRRHKQARPRKSPRADDPTFRGVAIRMRPELVSRNESKLHITAVWHLGKHRECHGRRHCCHVVFPDRKDGATCLDGESVGSRSRKHVYHTASKYCASCGTKKTPLWRDAEDGTSLCNACGIRYKKYKVRCGHCWHIPRKDSKQVPRCSRCDQVLRIPIIRKTK